MEIEHLRIFPALRKASARLASMNASEFVERSLHGPSVHLLRARSKMLRPSLVLLGAQAVGENPDRFVDLAVAAELIHVSSLIHDDIIDGYRKRRGADAVHVRYGSQAAILAGDALISKAVEIAAQYGPATLKSLSRATMNMCAGEILDYNYRKARKIPTLAQYRKVAYLKSGSLIGACWNAASVYKSGRNAERMYAAGSEMGIAFQIRDDIFDFIRERRKGTSNLVPNAVTSILRDYHVDRYSAVVRAVELNNRYIDASGKRLGGTREGRLLSRYASLIRVSV